ncbi:MAG: hypothetical protein OEY14_16140, partial [Myxococcales bacterium]|nr:hypothetical protein [Myxococcales bacterium]
RSGEEIGSGFVIFGAEVSRLLRLLDDRTPFEGVFERLGEPQARWFRYTLNLVVAAEGVPEGVARDVFFIRDRAQPLAGGNLLHVQAGAPDAAGLRALCVGALLPRRDLEDGRGYLEGIRERVLDSLGELMPFLTRHLHLLDSPHDGRPPRDVREGVDLGIAEPWTRGPAMMQAIHAHPVRGALGVCAMPVRMPIRRLLLCGRQVVPGLGMEGRLLAAWSAARIVTKADPRKEWMRGSLWSRLDI